MENQRLDDYTFEDLEFFKRLANRGWHLRQELTGLEIERFCQMAEDFLKLKEIRNEKNSKTKS